MNILTNREAFVVENMGWDSDNGHWYIHDTFKVSGTELLGLMAFSCDDEKTRLDFSLNKEIVSSKAKTPSLREIKRLLDEALSKLPKHVMDDWG